MTLNLRTHYRLAITITAACALLLAVTGCKGGGASFLLDKQPVKLREAITNAVPMTVTNTVYSTNFVTTTNIVTTTNAAGQVATAAQVLTLPTVTAQTQVLATTNYVVTPAVWYTNIDLNPIVEKGITGAGAISSPFTGGIGGMVAAGIIGASHVFFSFRNRRSQRAAQTALDNSEASHDATKNALGVAKDAVSTLVGNIDEINATIATIYPDYATKRDGSGMTLQEKVLQNIQRAQQLAGVHDTIAPVVDAHTNIAEHAPVTIQPTAASV